MESTRKYKKVKKDKAPKVLNQAIDLQGDDYDDKKPEEKDEESEDYLDPDAETNITDLEKKSRRIKSGKMDNSSDEESSANYKINVITDNLIFGLIILI